MEKSILLVDDEAGIRKVLGISLMDMGYQVLTAANGREAIRVLEDHSPGIVLTDIKMPEMDGLELLRYIKKHKPDTEVIMMTGHGDMDLAIKSVKYEATDFVTKPVNDEILEIALNRARERIDLRRQLNEYTHNLEQLVREKTQKLIEAERLAAIGQTVADISHAIKNIAGGLKGGAFVLEKGIELEKQQYLLQGWEMIKSNVDKITSLSMDLLNYAKGIEINYQLADPNQPVREVIQLMTPLATEHGIDLKAEIDPDLSKLNYDPELIHSCLLNLVTNAIDACKADQSTQGTKKVTVSTSQRPGHGVEYRVADNGCGLDAQTRAKLFQRFFTTKGSAGTGIGLMATKKIVDAHGGEIRVESRKNQGSTFTIRIPQILNLQ